MLQLLTELVQWLRWGWRWCTSLWSSSLICSMGFKSAFEGRDNTLMLFWVRKPMTILGVWGRALSCWNISLYRSLTLNICGCKISSLQRWAVKISCTQIGAKRPFRGLYTWVRPSHFWRRKRDSSLNQSRRKFLKVQTLSVWLQRTRARLYTWVKNDPT